MKSMTEMYIVNGKTAIRTHAASEDNFLADFASLLSRYGIGAVIPHQAIKTLLWQAVEICCKLRGLGSTASEDRTIVAGDRMLSGPPIASIDETGEVFSVKP